MLKDPPPIKDGRMVLSEAPGLGSEPDLAGLRELRVCRERAQGQRAIVDAAVKPGNDDFFS